MSSLTKIAQRTNQLSSTMISSSVLIAFIIMPILMATAMALPSSAPIGAAMIVSGSSEIIPPPPPPSQQSPSTHQQPSISNPSTMSIPSSQSQQQALSGSSNNNNNNLGSSQKSPPASHHNQQQQSLANPTRLPNINIYIEKTEIRKLLGIDARINYVSEGNINTYPLSFTIPLGYNQSDIIFTWQNMGQTNVNYSISLIISNIQAVDPPLINITRSGLIPKHEQVFKITLPCSGKVTDEVDVQILINILGYVDDSQDSSSPSSSSVLDQQQQQQQADQLQAQLASAESMMQSDQASEQSGKRLVSHTLAIKRKKICTVHPVPVQPRVPTLLKSQPPTPVPHIMDWSTQTPPQQIPSKQPNQRGANKLQDPYLNRNRADQDNLAQATPSSNSIDMPDVHTMSLIPDRPSNNLARHIPAPPMNWNYPIRNLPPIPPENPLNEIIPPAPRQPVQATNTNTANGGALVLTLIALSMLILIVLVMVLVLGSSTNSRQNPLDKLSTLTSCILRRTPGSQSSSSKCKSPMASAVIGSLRAGPKSSASSVSGLSAISGQSLNQHPHQKQATAAAYCYKNGNCSTCYTTTPTNNNNNSNSNNSNFHYQQQHQYQHQHPPTADLLGTGYSCQPPTLAPPQYPIYHIATGNNPNQTTRLIWNNANNGNDGFMIDANTYMPLSNAPRSDTESFYQTIH